jgi:hypothetical protein
MARASAFGTRFNLADGSYTIDQMYDPSQMS